MVAAGAYIRAMRERNKLTREQVAKLTGTSVSQLVRIEKGVQDTRASLLNSIVEAVRGDIQEVQRLLASKDATAEDGRATAERVTQILEETGAVEYLETPEDVAELLRLFEEELTSLGVDERRSLGDQLRGFLAGFRAARRRSGD